MGGVTTDDVRRFWEHHPVAAASIPFRPGTGAFFHAFDRLRATVEPPALQRRIYRFEQYRGKRVLDVGCGNGYLLSQYVRAGAVGTGVDLTWTAIELARKRLSLAGVNAMLLQADGERLPFREASFDLVIAIGVLHHTPDPRQAVREIHRVLSPGGTIVVMLYHRDSFYYRVSLPIYRRFHKDLKGMSSEELVRHVDGRENPLGRVYSRREAIDLLRQFRDVEVHCGSFPRESVPKIGRLLPKRILESAARCVGWFLFARGVK